MKNYLIEILTSSSTEKDILNIINYLSSDTVNNYIDEIVSNYSFLHNIIHIKHNGMNIQDKKNRQSKRLINVLSKNDYYRQKIIDLNENDYTVIKDNDFSMVKKLKVDTKEDFFKVLKMFRCQDFILLNLKNFNFNQEDKLIFKKYCKHMKINRGINQNEKKIFIEKTGLLYPIFCDLNLYDKFNQDEYNFFKSIFNDKNLNTTENIGRLLLIVFLQKINLDVDKINKKIYLDFFKEHTDLIKEIEDFSLNMYNTYKDKNIKRLIGLADKLICEEQLKSF